jgi:hypothetical protein
MTMTLNLIMNMNMNIKLARTFDWAKEDIIKT